MTVVLVSWIYIAAVCMIAGTGFNLFWEKLTGYAFCSAEMYFLSGMAAIGVYAQLFSLLSGLGAAANALLVAACVIMCIAMRGRIAAWVGRVWKSFRGLAVRVLAALAIVALCAVFTAQTPTFYDSYLYHAQAIRWIEEYGCVPGLGNLHNRFAYNSSFLVLQALFSFRWLTGSSLHTLNGLIAAVFLLYSTFSLKVWKRHRLYVSDALRFVMIWYILYYAQNLSSPNTDTFALALVLYIFTKWFDALEERETRPEPYAWLCLMAVFACTLKLSSAFALILLVKPIAMLLRDHRLGEFLRYVVCALLIALPFLVRNVMISGYILYPYSSIDIFPFLDWKMDAASAEIDRKEICVWGRGIQNAGETYDVEALYSWPLSQWLPIWFGSLPMVFRVMFAAALLCSVGIVLQNAAILAGMASRLMQRVKDQEQTRERRRTRERRGRELAREYQCRKTGDPARRRSRHDSKCGDAGVEESRELARGCRRRKMENPAEKRLRHDSKCGDAGAGRSREQAGECQQRETGERPKNPSTKHSGTIYGKLAITQHDILCRWNDECEFSDGLAEDGDAGTGEWSAADGDYLLVSLAAVVCLYGWLLSAPLIRYGGVYMMVVIMVFCCSSLQCIVGRCSVIRDSAAESVSRRSAGGALQDAKAASGREQSGEERESAGEALRDAKAASGREQSREGRGSAGEALQDAGAASGREQSGEERDSAGGALQDAEAASGREQSREERGSAGGALQDAEAASGREQSREERGSAGEALPGMKARLHRRLFSRPTAGGAITVLIGAALLFHGGKVMLNYYTTYGVSITYQDYGQIDCVENEWEGYIIYTPVSGDQTDSNLFPAIPYESVLSDIELRGKTFADGFRRITSTE